jgi:hypothetical protein
VEDAPEGDAALSADDWEDRSEAESPDPPVDETLKDGQASPEDVWEESDETKPVDTIGTAESVEEDKEPEAPPSGDVQSGSLPLTDEIPQEKPEAPEDSASPPTADVLQGALEGSVEGSLEQQSVVLADEAVNPNQPKDATDAPVLGDVIDAALGAALPLAAPESVQAHSDGIAIVDHSVTTPQMDATQAPPLGLESAPRDGTPTQTPANPPECLDAEIPTQNNNLAPPPEDPSAIRPSLPPEGDLFSTTDACPQSTPSPSAYDSDADLPARVRYDVMAATVAFPTPRVDQFGSQSEALRSDFSGANSLADSGYESDCDS